MDKDAFFDSVSAFILDHRPVSAAGRPAMTAVPAGDNLFDLGLVDSYTMLDIVSYVEQITGSQIDIMNIDIARLFTLEEMYGVVFGP